MAHPHNYQSDIDQSDIDQSDIDQPDIGQPVIDADDGYNVRLFDTDDEAEINACREGLRLFDTDDEAEINACREGLCAMGFIGVLVLANGMRYFYDARRDSLQPLGIEMAPLTCKYYSTSASSDPPSTSAYWSYDQLLERAPACAAKAVPSLVCSYAGRFSACPAYAPEVVTEATARPEGADQPITLRRSRTGAAARPYWWVTQADQVVAAATGEGAPEVASSAFYATAAGAGAAVVAGPDVDDPSYIQMLLRA